MREEDSPLPWRERVGLGCPSLLAYRTVYGKTVLFWFSFYACSFLLDPREIEAQIGLSPLQCRDVLKNITKVPSWLVNVACGEMERRTRRWPLGLFRFAEKRSYIAKSRARSTSLLDPMFYHE